MSTFSAPAITVRGLRKSFGDKLVLDDIDLEVSEGRIWALLGPNGAGKTTMVRILTTLIRADAGTIRVGGHDVAADPDAVRRMIGVTGQFAAVDEMLTGEENLLLMGDLYHQPPGSRADSVLWSCCTGSICETQPGRWPAHTPEACAASSIWQ